ncbi:hypothetical protein ACHAWX_000768, partial [Stephanocyclus meneghinianus]
RFDLKRNSLEQIFTQTIANNADPQEAETSSSDCRDCWYLFHEMTT